MTNERGSDARGDEANRPLKFSILKANTVIILKYSSGSTATVSLGHQLYD